MSEIHSIAGGAEVIKTESGTWVWDASSTLPDDGLTVICPDSHSLPAEELAVDLTGGAQLTHGSIVFGSLTLEGVANSDYDCSDWELNGHSWHMEPILAFNAKLIDHEAGTLAELVADVFHVRYRYCAMPGRWLRVWGDRDPVTPDMLMDPSFSGDETHAIRWAINKAAELGRDLFIDREYFYTGILEIPSGLVIYGRGMDEPGLSVDAFAVIEKYRIDSTNVEPINGVETVLEQRLQNTRPALIPKPYATGFTLRDLQLDGNTDQVSWMDVRDTGSWDATEFAHQMQDAPHWAAVVLTTHGARPNDNPTIRLERVHAHDYCSAMMLLDGNVQARGLKLGSCVGNRPLYRCHGRIEDLETYGHTRFSVARINQPIVIDGWKHRGTQAGHPWPEIVTPNAPLCDEENLTGYGDTLDGRTQQVTTIRNVDIDATGFGTAFRLGSETELQGVLHNAVTAWQINDKSEGDIARIKGDLVTVNSNPPELAWPWSNAKALISRLDLTRVNRNTIRTPGTVDRHWVVYVGRNVKHKADHQQHLRIHSDNDWPTQTILHFPDLFDRTGLVDTIPTFVHLSGVYSQTLARLACFHASVTTQGDVPTIKDLPVRVLIQDAVFSMLAPGGAMLNNSYDLQFELVKLHNCRTHDGMLSEQQGTLQGVEGSDLIELDTELLWKPRDFRITPLSPNAARFFRGVEWEVLNPGAVNEDARRPRLRLRLCHELDAAEALDVKYQWSAAVSP